MKFLSTLFLLFFCQTFGQELHFSIIDSLEKQLNSTTDKKSQIEILLKLSDYSNKNSKSFEYEKQALKIVSTIPINSEKYAVQKRLGIYFFHKSDSAQSLEHFRNAFEISQSLNDTLKQIEILEFLGVAQNRFLNFSNSKNYLQSAIHLAESIKDPIKISSLTAEYGNVYYQSLNFPTAFELYQKAYFISKSQKDEMGMIKSLRYIGELYYHLEQFDKTLECIDEVIELGVKIKDSKIRADCYSWRGNIFMNQGKFEESLKEYERSIQIKKELNDELGLASDYANIAWGNTVRENYTLALLYHQKSFELNEKNNFQFGQILYFKDMGYLIQKAPDSILTQLGVHPNNRFQTSLEYEKKALKIAEEIGDTPQILYILNYMVAAYEALGDFESAYATNTRYNQLKNEMTGNQTKAEIARNEAKIYFEKRELEERSIQERQKSKIKTQYSIAIGMACFLALIGFGLYQYARIKKRKEKLRYEENHQILAIEKEKMETELILAKGEMNQFIENLNQKNLMIEKLTDELNQVSQAFDQEKVVLRANLREIKESVILTDQDWVNFRTRFGRIYPDFEMKIRTEYPKITLAELRYLMLVKIGLTNKDMARTLGVSLNTIHVTWKRLREKLNLSKEESPQDVLNFLESSSTTHSN